MIKLKISQYIKMGKKKIKKYSLNLNQYRNWHFIISNNLKVEFGKTYSKDLSEFNIKGKQLYFTFKLYKGSKRRIDKDNVICIVKKFLYDMLTQEKIIEDDNDDIIKDEHSFQTELDENKEGYVEVCIFTDIKEYKEFIIKTL